jgi:hypothetical protein
MLEVRSGESQSQGNVAALDGCGSSGHLRLHVAGFGRRERLTAVHDIRSRGGGPKVAACRSTNWLGVEGQTGRQTVLSSTHDLYTYYS